ncbi:MAG: DNA-binding response regulator [Lentisphaerae bacterium RIFOXYB12_FULL_65_16]|nr:MAG: DNA-binding response regulator [Lentisphaerae bacterium RIFOXYA12_64_32]OGV93360.1 MAG: DNA-binding response regulator [Lentisphaerae bacterium RIFOXYB12_FULL_65_16]
MERSHILVVDDEKDILELISYNLAKSGYRVTSVTTGEEALEKVRSDRPDLVVLDLMLPGLDGLDVCRILTNDPTTANVPILMLTARGEDADVVTGLELGAQDYVTKPFSPRVLLARVRVLLRRQGGAQEDTEPTAVLKRGRLVIDPRRREVRVGDTLIDLTYTEFSLLHFLARRPGWVFTRSQIIGAVHGDEYPVTERSVDVQIVGLRRKLGPSGDLIETVRGVGYRFKE